MGVGGQHHARPLYPWERPGTHCTGGCGSRVSSVCLVTRHGLCSPGIESRRGARFCTPVQTCSGAHPVSYTRSRGSFPCVKRSGGGVDHPPPFSAEVSKFIHLLPLWAFVACYRVNFSIYRLSYIFIYIYIFLTNFILHWFHWFYMFYTWIQRKRLLSAKLCRWFYRFSHRFWYMCPMIIRNMDRNWFAQKYNCFVCDVTALTF
jgi:hypothetical protein